MLRSVKITSCKLPSYDLLRDFFQKSFSVHIICSLCLKRERNRLDQTSTFIPISISLRSNQIDCYSDAALSFEAASMASYNSFRISSPGCRFISFLMECYSAFYV